MDNKNDAFVEDIRDAIDSANISSVFCSIETTAFNVTTMTVMLTTDDKSGINLSEIMEKADQFPSSLKARKAHGFFNCIMCSWTPEPEGKAKGDDKVHAKGDDKVHAKGVKIFSNGQVHVTGTKSAAEAIECGRCVYEAIGRSPDMITDFTVQLINGHFKFLIGDDKFIQLSKLHALCVKDTTYMCRYFPENHAGLLVRIPVDDVGAVRTMTVMFFESGSVLINAFTTGAELKKAFDFALEIIDKHADEVLGTSLDRHEGSMPAKRVRRSAETGGFDYGKYLVLK